MRLNGVAGYWPALFEATFQACFAQKSQTMSLLARVEVHMWSPGGGVYIASWVG